MKGETKLKANLAKSIKGIKAVVTKHAPEILTGVGIAGMVITTVSAVKATPKALQIIEEKKKKENKEELKPMEVVQATWKCYAPAVITGITSIGCLIGGSSVSARRNAALATAYNLSRTTLKDYKEKVIETIGEDKEQAIRDKIAKEKIEQNPVSKTQVIISEKGNTLCYDSVGGRYFRSDIDHINKVVNELNRRMLVEDYISLNDFYSELGLKDTDLGDEIGWNLGREGYIELDFSSQISEDGQPCLVIGFTVGPRYEYHKSYM